jgi:anti-sigma factor RsiW
MTDDPCAEMRLKLQADLDGELSPGEAASVAAHALSCPACAALQAELGGLSTRLRTELPYHAVPAALRQRIVASMAVRAAQVPAPSPLSWIRRLLGGPSERLRMGTGFGAGFALAACLALLLVLPRAGGDTANAVVSSHIRALQPGHLIDVTSSDQHTVKPWFDGRLDYAPPVRDLAAEGFPLLGGRLDYLEGRPVAALAYGRAKHIINLYVWPLSSGSAPLAWSGHEDGYNIERWSRDGMVFWAVSDVEAAQLHDFATLWQRG